MYTVKVSYEQRMYIITGENHTSCLGFEVCKNRLEKAYAWAVAEIAKREPELLVRFRQKFPFAVASPAVGTMEMYTAYTEIQSEIVDFCARHGCRATYELNPALTAYHGETVQCKIYGEKVRFKVGRSTGAIPMYLMLKTARSTGGEAISADTVIEDLVAV